MEVVVEVFGQLFLEFGWRTLSEGFRERQRAHPLLSAAALALLGGVFGVVISLAFPNRLFGFQGIRGTTMVVSPLVTGTVMEAYGRWCDRHGRERSNFATFWGGAIFAFSMAAMRFYFVGTGR